MTNLLPALAVAFAAFCVWLTMRIVNRRERWAKWTLAAVVAVPVLYVASFGPVVWLSHNETFLPDWTWDAAAAAYHPVIWVEDNGPQPIADSISWYLDFWRLQQFREPDYLREENSLM